jgi:hypothetical protein
MKIHSIPLLACAATLMAASATGTVHARTDAATPWGIEIGGACQTGLAKLGAVKQKSLGERDTLYVAEDNNTLYQGAKEVTLRCKDDKIIALQLVAPKEGMGNPAARAAYQALAKNYKRVAGGPIPQLGDGYARFVKGNSVIEISAPHLDFDFTLTYLTQGFYNQIVANNKRLETQASTSRAGM